MVPARHPLRSSLTWYVPGLDLSSLDHRQHNRDDSLNRKTAPMTADKIEDIYKLSPLQHGILMHCLAEPTAGLYFEQFSWSSDRPLDLPAFARAWALVQAQHPVLRTAFFWEGLDEPMQVVQQQVALPLTLLDWRASPPPAQERLLAVFLAADRRQGFDLSLPPLMRLTIIHFTGAH